MAGQLNVSKIVVIHTRRDHVRLLLMWHITCMRTWSQSRDDAVINIIIGVVLSRYSKRSHKGLRNNMVTFVFLTCPCCIFAIKTIMISMHKMLWPIWISDDMIQYNGIFKLRDSPAHFVQRHHLCSIHIPFSHSVRVSGKPGINLGITSPASNITIGAGMGRSPNTRSGFGMDGTKVAKFSLVKDQASKYNFKLMMCHNVSNQYQTHIFLFFLLTLLFLAIFTGPLS
jgi:hypothetical protein